MTKMALEKIVQAALLIGVTLIAAFFLIPSILGEKRPLDMLINNSLKDIVQLQNTSSNETSSLIKNKINYENLVKSFTAAGASSKDICRINTTLNFAANKKEGYNFAIINNNEKLYYNYSDIAQGLSFEKEVTGFSSVQVIKDGKGFLEKQTVYQILELQKKYNNNKLAILETNKNFMSADYFMDVTAGKTGSILYLYQKNIIDIKLDAKSLSQKYIWNTAFKVGTTLVFIDGDYSWTSGVKDSDRQSEINLIPIC